jgi:hypothetical protein
MSRPNGPAPAGIGEKTCPELKPECELLHLSDVTHDSR